MEERSPGYVSRTFLQTLFEENTFILLRLCPFVVAETLLWRQLGLYRLRSEGPLSLTLYVLDRGELSYFFFHFFLKGEVQLVRHLFRLFLSALVRK